MTAWKTLTKPKGANLLSLWGYGDGPLFMCSEDYTDEWTTKLLRSDNFGKSWTEIKTRHKGYFRKVIGAAPNDIFVLSGYFSNDAELLHSSDGITFKSLPIGKQGSDHTAAIWGDEIYVGSDVLYRSDNHGKKFTFIDKLQGSITALLCLGSKHLLKIESGKIAESLDGGLTWNNLNFPSGHKLECLRGSFDYGLYTMTDDTVWTSKDEGKTWQVVFEKPENLNDIAVWGPKDLYIVTKDGNVLHSTDDRKFTIEFTHSSGALHSVSIVNEDVFVVGQIGLVASIHRGPRPQGAAIFTPTETVKKSSESKKSTKEALKDTISASLLQKQIEKRDLPTLLNIDLDHISSLAALAQAPEVTQLSLSGRIPDLSTMPVLPNLKELYLGGKPKDLTALAKQPALTDLQFFSAKQTLVGLSEIKTLRRLKFDNDELPDFAPIAASTSLEELELPGKTPALSGLWPCKSLRKLSIPELSESVRKLSLIELYSSTSSLHMLKEMTTLEVLVVSGSFEDLSPLKNLTNLRELGIRSEDIEDFSVLQHLTKLRKLSIYCKHSIDLSPLQSLHSLEELDLTFCPLIKEWSVLSKLTSLKVLNIKQTGISNLSPLRTLKNLETLNIEDLGKVKHDEALQGLTNLQKLEARDTQINTNHLTGLTKLLDVGGHDNPRIELIVEASNKTLGPGSVFPKHVQCITFSTKGTNQIALSPDGSQVAIVGEMNDKKSLPIQRFATSDGRPLKSLGNAKQSVEGVAYSMDGKQLFYAVHVESKGEHKLELWSTPVVGKDSAEKIGKIKGRRCGTLHPLSDGNTLAIAGNGVDFWDLTKGDITLTMKAEYRVHAFAARNTPAIYLSGLNATEIVRFDYAKQETTNKWEISGTPLVDHDERFLTTVGVNAHGVFVLDLKKNQRILPTKFHGQHSSPVLLSPDGTLLIELDWGMYGYRLPEATKRVHGPLIADKGAWNNGFSSVAVAKDANVIACSSQEYNSTTGSAMILPFHSSSR